MWSTYRRFTLGFRFWLSLLCRRCRQLAAGIKKSLDERVAPRLHCDDLLLHQLVDRIILARDFRHAGLLSKGLLDGAVAANDCPEVLRFLEVRQRGGFRGRVLGWVLGNSR